MSTITYRYNPSSDGLRVLNPNQTATLILKNNKSKAQARDCESYARFKMRESQIADITGRIISSDERWALIEAMNDLGWQVAICKHYWTFIKTSIVERWPTLNNSEVISLSTELSRTSERMQVGPLSENFDDFDTEELAKFFHSKEVIKDIVEEIIYERNFDGGLDPFDLGVPEELEEEELEEYIQGIDIESIDLNKFINKDQFSIWEYLYFDLFKGNLIEDVFKLKAK